MDWYKYGYIVARGARVTGLGPPEPFGEEQPLVSGEGNFGGIAVGPGPNGGKVMVTYMSPLEDEGPAWIYANVDADGLGPGGFGQRITVTATNVGGRDYIPAQPTVSIDAEPGLVWDATSGPFNNRVYLVYTDEEGNESNDTDIKVRMSTDDGTTWSAPVRVNDDPMGVIRSQFLPYITLDPTSGTVAIGWHDARNDNGVPGSGGTNNTPNDDAEYYASYSTNGGVTWAANTRLSGGFSNAANAGNIVDYGDFVGTNAYGGKFVGVWADNSNCDGTNANGTLHAFDLYMGTMNIPGVPQPTSTPVPTSVPSPTRTPVTCSSPGNYTIAPTPSSIYQADTLVYGGPSRTAVPISFPSGFTFTLYDRTSTTGAIASTNGVLEFMGSNIREPNIGGNECLPADQFDYSIMPYWAQLNINNNPNSPYHCTADQPCGIYTSVQNTPGGRIFHIIWKACQIGVLSKKPTNDVPYCGQDNSAYVEFEVKLYEGQSRFETGYGYMQGFNGVEAVIGVQKHNSNAEFTLFSCNEGLGTTNGLTFTLCSLPPTPTPQPPRPTNTPIPTPTLCRSGCGEFHDVPTDYVFYSYIKCLRCNYIVDGYQCGGPGEPCDDCNMPYFHPGYGLVRGQMAKIISNAAGWNEVAPGQNFEDVPPDNPYYLWVQRISSRGVIGGYDCGSMASEPCVLPDNRPYFRPYANATRGQISKAVSNARGFTETPTGQAFEDTPPRSTFYLYVERVALHEIISGYQCSTDTGSDVPCVPPNNRPYFQPQNDVTRGQAAKIVAKAWNGGSTFSCNLTYQDRANPSNPLGSVPVISSSTVVSTIAPTAPTMVSTPATTPATPTTNTPGVSVTPTMPPTIQATIPPPQPTIPLPIPTGQTTIVPSIPPVPTAPGTVGVRSPTMPVPTNPIPTGTGTITAKQP